LTQEEEIRANDAPEVIVEAGDTNVVPMVDDQPNKGRLSDEGILPKEMHAEAREVTAGDTAAAQNMERGTGDDAASSVSFRSCESR
jgi:hypothetical protein